MLEPIEPLALTNQLQDAATRAGFKIQTLAAINSIPILAASKCQIPTNQQPNIYVSSGIHGDEPAGPLALLSILRQGIFDHRANWFICPLLNPAGLAKQTRENAQGIDLNRDYLHPKSIEVQRHLPWLKNLPPLDLFISLHEDYESTGFYLYEINCLDCPTAAHHILEAVSPIFPPEPQRLIDDHSVRELGWIFHEPEADFPDQWPEAIYLAKHQTTVSYTFETPSSAALDRRIEAHLAATQAALQYFT